MTQKRTYKGCGERATLGTSDGEDPTPTGLWPPRFDPGHNPVGVADPLDTIPQGSSFLATLGFGSESLWDSLPGRRRLWGKRGIHAAPLSVSRAHRPVFKLSPLRELQRHKCRAPRRPRETGLHWPITAKLNSAREAATFAPCLAVMGSRGVPWSSTRMANAHPSPRNPLTGLRMRADNQREYTCTDSWSEPV